MNEPNPSTLDSTAPGVTCAQDSERAVVRSVERPLSKLERRLLGRISRASKRYELIEPDDRIMVAVSGGKDSWALLHLLRRMRKKVPFDFSLVAVNLDQGHPGFPQHVLREYFEREGYEYRIVERDTFSVVKEKVPEGKTYCSLCSRLRRGILYDTAVDLGCTKIALGHHRDDVIETLLLNILYSGQLKAMPAKLFSDDGRNVVIRPLIDCAEEEIAAFAMEQEFPIVPCDLCGTQENLHRQKIKRLLAELQAENGLVKGNIMAAIGNVRPSHLLDLELRRRCGAETEPSHDDGIDAIEAPRHDGCAFAASS